MYTQFEVHLNSYFDYPRVSVYLIVLEEISTWGHDFVGIFLAVKFISFF